jgi:murein L,D-transpeptidase YafK
LGNALKASLGNCLPVGEFALQVCTPVRALMTSAALAASLVLASCNGEDVALNNAKANKPIPDKLLAEMETKDMDPQSPILVRIFKQEAELEVWKQNRSGRFELLKAYPICRWSGDLGPKIKEGDRQAPEGFYTISPAQMNPQSAYYLSFNTGYPNAFDKSLGRSGSELMVHGDCSSRGCYAMTDEQISEIYSLGREAFFGGQRAFQFQAYPFRMTAKNMARHRNNPNMPFWKMLKEGSDHFEVTHLEPKVDVCEKHYVFDAQPDPSTNKPLSFSPAGKCPAYTVAEDIAQAVQDKGNRDNTEVAELVARGEPTAPMRRGIDGGMNAVFAAKLPDGQTGLSDTAATASYSSTPGSLPPTVNPPRAPEPVIAAAPEPPAAAPATRVASADSSAKSEGFFASLARKIGLGGSSDTTATTSAKSNSKGGKAVAAAPKPAEAKTIASVQTPQPKPAPAPAKPADVASSDAVPGAQPVVSSSSFDSRFSTTR